MRNIENGTTRPDTQGPKREMERLIRELYPICRSLTGDGVRETLRILQKTMALEIHSVPSGTPVFDWVVPKEWNIRSAFIKDPAGNKVVDFADSNLHVVGYSVPFQGRLSLKELKEHLYTIPDHPDWIPYRTSYYRENWGFCLTQRKLDQLSDGVYDVSIDSTLRDGHLNYGESFLPGESRDEVLFSCHICHPSLCNDNLSGISVMAALYDHLRRQPRRLSYRFLFIPGTIGSITWLAMNESKVPFIKHGFVLAGVGDRGNFTYKKSRRGDAGIDRAFEHVVKNSKGGASVIGFHPYGYDERQFCSPGFNLAVGCVMRTPFGEYPEYHTSADNLDFMDLDNLADSLNKCIAALDILEFDEVYVNQNPKCEPQLGKRGLYSALGGQMQTKVDEMALLWILNQSDGFHSLLDIAEKSGYPFEVIRRNAERLAERQLLKKKLEPDAQNA